MGFGFLMGWRNKKPYKIFPLIYGKENIVGSKKKGNLGWVMVRQKRDSLSKLTAYMVWIFLGGNLTA